MDIQSLSQYITQLESKGELIRIKEFVNPDLEITEIADRIMKQSDGGKALLFENTGTEFPLLINHYGSDIRTCMSLGISDFSEPARKMDDLFKKLIENKSGFKSKLALLPELKNASKWMPKTSNKKGKCQEVIIDKPNLSKLPILKCWPHDGGKFITLPMVISEDPETGIRNVGMYRMQIFDDKTTGMHWHLHKGGAAHFNKYKELGERMPISVVLGGDPALTFCATAPLPENIDEFMLAGFLRGKGVKLVKSITNDIYIPEFADFVIEGYVDPSEDFVTEGPFGDHTGFYSLADEYPVFHVTCITHRKDAIYPATIVGVPPMEDFYLGKATEKIFLKPIQIAIAPEIIDMRLPSYGVAHNLVLIKAKTSYAGQSNKIMNALLGAGQMMFSKAIVCFNENVDITNDQEVMNAIINNVDISQDVSISQGPSDVLDHSAYKYTLGGKLLIDASKEKVARQKLEFTNNTDLIPLYHFNGVCIIRVEKTQNLKETAKEILTKNKISGIKILVLIDSETKIESPYLLAWYILNNIDPKSDCLIFSDILIVDASAKAKEIDGFSREWPNVVTMDKKTIETIDNKWEALIGQPFIDSPSHTLLKLIENDSATHYHNK